MDKKLLLVGVLGAGAYLLLSKKSSAASSPKSAAPALLGEYGTPLQTPAQNGSVGGTINVSTWSSGIITLSLSKVASDGQITDSAAYSTIVGLGPSLDAGVPVVLLAEKGNPTYRAFYRGTAKLAYSPTPSQGGDSNWWDAQWVKDAEMAALQVAGVVADPFTAGGGTVAATVASAAIMAGYSRSTGRMGANAMGNPWGDAFTAAAGKATADFVKALVKKRTPVTYKAGVYRAPDGRFYRYDGHRSTWL